MSIPIPISLALLIITTVGYYQDFILKSIRISWYRIERVNSAPFRWRPQARQPVAGALRPAAAVAFFHDFS